ncbi:response regulator [Paraburkholderia terrae]
MAGTSDDGCNLMRAEVVANILLVDDDPENLWAAQVALEGDGHRVTIANGGARALDVLRRYPIELVVTDYEMPEIDGVELCRIIRARPAYSELPIVLLSAAPEPRCSVQFWTTFLRKPASFDDLLAVIDAHAARRINQTESMSLTIV